MDPDSVAGLDTDKYKPRGIDDDLHKERRKMDATNSKTSGRF